MKFPGRKNILCVCVSQQKCLMKLLIRLLEAFHTQFVVLSKAIYIWVHQTKNRMERKIPAFYKDKNQNDGGK